MKVLVTVMRVFDPYVMVRVKSVGTGVDITPRLKTLKVQEPPKRSAGVKVADVQELVAKLKNEARVI